MKVSQNKTAIIVGNQGQDGAYLTQLLKQNKYRIVGINRNGITCDEKQAQGPIDLENRGQVQNIINEYKPDEIYYLAAVHQSSEEQREEIYQGLIKSFSVHVGGLLNFLESIRLYSPSSKFFYAASSHIFGKPEESPQKETTPFRPICQYGITKTTGIEICRLYRKEKGLFCSVGILYNHESPLRSLKFLSKKIVTSVVKIKLGLHDELVLGDLKATVDWGHAKDFVKAMHSILQLEHPDDFIIATGKLHQVENFANIAFDLLGLKSSDYLKENKDLLKKQIHNIPLCGDTSKILELADWRPQYSFKTMIEEMVFDELKRQKCDAK